MKLRRCRLRSSDALPDGRRRGRVIVLGVVLVATAGLVPPALAVSSVASSSSTDGTGVRGSTTNPARAPYLTDVVPTARGCIVLGPAWAGVKVLLLQRRLGTTIDRERYLSTTQRAVRRFQATHRLPVTGRVDRTTWQALGIDRPFCMDRFTVQPSVGLDAGTHARIRTMLAFARAQVGRRYVWSGAGRLGYDCSGLALQALHAGGLVLPTVTTYRHQHSTFPTATAIRDSGLDRVPFDQRRRGDLVYWGPPGTVTHMALYLGHNRIVEAVRPRVRVTSVWSHEVPIKAYAVRPFPLS